MPLFAVGCGEPVSLAFLQSAGGWRHNILISVNISLQYLGFCQFSLSALFLVDTLTINTYKCLIIIESDVYGVVRGATIAVDACPKWNLVSHCLLALPLCSFKLKFKCYPGLSSKGCNLQHLLWLNILERTLIYEMLQVMYVGKLETPEFRRNFSESVFFILVIFFYSPNISKNTLKIFLKFLKIIRKSVFVFHSN